MSLNNLTWHLGSVSPADRHKSLAQKPLTLWLTGLSAAGKSTLAFAVERALHNMGRTCYVLDGDNVRHGLNKDLGFSAADRSENIRRVAEVSRLMNDAGLIVITAFISPLRQDREAARTIIGASAFREIYVNPGIGVCERRDPKGLYKKARSGDLPEFTGVSAPYEAPFAADLELDTGAEPVEESAKRLSNFVLAHIRIA
jgi:adenylyl-sulfate kinase